MFYNHADKGDTTHSRRGKLKMKIPTSRSFFTARCELNTGSFQTRLKALVLLAMLVAGILTSNFSLALTVNVVSQGGSPMTNGFRWIVESDTTFDVPPGVPVPGSGPGSVLLAIQQSYCPVLTTGRVTTSSVTIPVPSTSRYVVSVLPDSGYTMSAGTAAIGQTDLTIMVHATPVPTAQISITVFNDNNPINNAQDAPEPGLSGFKVVISDNMGMVSQDAFGNPLGTTYQLDTNREFIVDGDNMPLVDKMGNGEIYTDENGHAQIKYIVPARYPVMVIPPHGETWYQTTTIDGTPNIDAWVKLNEAATLVEFGATVTHVFFGMVNPSKLPWALNPPAGGGTITGRLVDDHFSKPPALLADFPGASVREGLIGLNDENAQVQGLYVSECNPDGTFVVSNVPPGTYQLVTWDKPLDRIIGFNVVTVASNGETVAMGDVLSLRWHAWLTGSVFYDENQNGFRDNGEVGMKDQALNIRFRDGSIVQSTSTGESGDYFFREITIWFAWLVAEVNYDRYKPTGITTVSDGGGGPILPGTNGWNFPSFGILNPQPQYDTDPVTGLVLTNSPIINPNTGNNLSRTETGPVLLEAMMNFQANVIDWGKAVYATNENGGIVGIAYYDTTRAENNAGQCVGEPWEPGIPRVQVNLYTDANHDKIIDDLNGDSAVTLADVDNYPFGWMDGSDPVPGPEDVDRNGNGDFDAGDAIQIVHTDSWDDNMPTGAIQMNTPIVHGQRVKPGYDAFGTWDQVRPGVFDGGYWFNSYFPGGIESGSSEVDGLPSGTYIVESVPPRGYELVKEEDKNVELGDSYRPSALQRLPECVGDVHVVPAELSLFPGVPTVLAGRTNRLADRKLITVNQGRNANCDFFFFTEVPKAARAVGIVTEDLHATFDTNHPFYGEKASPSWLPISFQDYAGHEVARVYCDEFGGYNAMLPSTYSVNVPSPSGVSPMMLMIVINDPTMPDPSDPANRIPDPFYNPDYTTESSTWDFWPGRTTYTDTPIMAQGGLLGYPNGPLDVEPADGTPVIFSVSGPSGGPFVQTISDLLTITARGLIQVPNPLYSSTNGLPLMVTRDFGFGSVQGYVTVNGIQMSILSWTTNTITATAPAAVPSGQLMITRGDNGLTTRIGITLTVGASPSTVRHVTAAPYPAHPIQDAIDSANPGDLILVEPGVYDENVIMYKPVKLQGSGAASTIIRANTSPSDRRSAWHDKMRDILGTPGSDPFSANDAPGIVALGSAGFTFSAITAARIDGIHITGAKIGSGITVATLAHYLQISNNRLAGNSGSAAGGISVGSPGATTNPANDHIVIRYNEVIKNGSTGAPGVSGAGGVGLYFGSDDYQLTDNFIMGNLTKAHGAGVEHLGLSRRGLIARNKIIFNESVNDLTGLGSGGGLFVGGDVPAVGLTPGAGTITVTGNLIQGNISGAGHGGGIRVEGFNGADVAGSPGTVNNWHALYLFDNIIVNNAAGYAGAGISLQDVARGVFIHNTVANNDSCATAIDTFPQGATNSTPQPAGIVAHLHSADLASAFSVATRQTFSNPTLYDNIVWHNRSLYITANPNVAGATGEGIIVTNPVLPYWDLQVWGATNKLNPRSSILSRTNGYHVSNIASNPLFAAEYMNLNVHATTPDEAGNQVSLRFSPIYPTGDYHIQSISPAIGRAESSFTNAYPAIRGDYDTDYRPYAGSPDIGADEYSVTTVYATNDSFFVNEDTRLTNGPLTSVLINDRPLGLWAALESGPANGTLTTFRTNGTFIYNPSTNFYGADSFTYRAVSGAARSQPAQVTITVRQVADTPIAVNDSYTVNGNGSITVPAPGVLINDTDPSSTPLTAILTLPPVSGTLTLNPDGSFTYTPLPWITGSLFFRYTASNGTQTSPPVTATLNIGAPKPDFVITGIVINPETVTTGKTFAAAITVKNQGTTAGIVGKLSVWVNSPGSDIPTGTVGNASANLGLLGIGTSTTVVFSALSAPAMVPADAKLMSATLRAFANSTGAQTEFLLDNNQLTKAYTVSSTLLADYYPPDQDGIDTDGDGNVSNDFVYVRLAAGDGFVKMADGRDMYVFGFSDATGLTQKETMEMNMLYAGTPAPTLVFREGQRVFIKLTNVGMMMRPDLFDPHTVHFHGFPNAAPIFDGEPMASVAVNMGSTFTYYYELVEPGTYLYHCHVEAPEHMQMGMLGNLWVEPKQNMLPNGSNLSGFTHLTGYKYAYNDGDGSTFYDVELPLQVTGMDSEFHDAEIEIQPLPLAGMKDDYFLLNGRGYPDTIDMNDILNVNGDPVQYMHSKLEANAGQKILLRLTCLSTIDYTTLTSTLPMRIVGRGARLLRGPDGAGGVTGKNLSHMTTSVTFGGGESYDAIIDTTGVAPGTYFIYSSNFNQLSNGTEDYGGIMTEIEIK